MWYACDMNYVISAILILCAVVVSKHLNGETEEEIISEIEDGDF